MKRGNNGVSLSTVFVDYDNIYLSLKRKNEEAAKRFAKDAPIWLAELISGRLITPTNGPGLDITRRIVMNRCYGNPVPRRNSGDNSTDMNSFPFVRHHFLRSGFEVVDCPPLTAQLKNSSDIRMVMDVRDYLNHDTYFDEFIILSGDADFTPLLHRLRAHARRTVIFANDYTAAPYTAISDGEVRESDLIALLLAGRTASQTDGNDALTATTRPALPSQSEIEAVRRDIVKEVIEAVRSAGQPVPLEALADRAVRNLGHDRTVGTAWGGMGGFRDLLLKALPDEIRLNEQPPYFVFDTGRQIAAPAAAAPAARDLVAQQIASEPIRQRLAEDLRNEAQRLEAKPVPQPEPRLEQRPLPAADLQPSPAQSGMPPERVSAAAEYAAARHGFAGQSLSGLSYTQQQQPIAAPIRTAEPQQPAARQPMLPQSPQPPAQQAMQQPMPERRPAPQQLPQQQSLAPAAQAAAPQTAAPMRQPAPQQPAASGPRAPLDGATAIQRSIARIHDACQAPPLSPPEYRALFDIMAEEITRNGLNGAQTLVNIAQRAQDLSIDVRRDDIRFVIDVVSETDPWFEQGASAKLFAGRFRNFVVARCRSQGLNLSADELDLIDAWFAGAPTQAQRAPARPQQPAPTHQQAAPPQQAMPAAEAAPAADRWWNTTPSPADHFGAPQDDLGSDEFPRIVRRNIR